jgi:hypothetical protein
MIPKAKLLQLAEMDLSVVMLDGQLANDAQEMATTLLQYQWRPFPRELPDTFGERYLTLNIEGYVDCDYWTPGDAGGWKYRDDEDIVGWMPTPPIPE